MNELTITYDYLKLSDFFDIPSVHLKKGNYDKALLGYLDFQKQNSNSQLINENEFNRLGYRLLGSKKYDGASNVFKILLLFFLRAVMFMIA